MFSTFFRVTSSIYVGSDPIDHHGDNRWLNTKDSHHDVRKDFIPADTGIRPRATLN